MQKILIINKAQLGYNTDSYKWCEHLNKTYQVTYFGFDCGLEKIIIPKVKVDYISYKGAKVVRGTRFIILALIKLLFFNGKIIVVFFNGCQIFKKVFPHKKMILDIRTLSISTDVRIRKKYNYNLRVTSSLYDHVTIISEELRRKIDIPIEKTSILPLGSDSISNIKKSFEKINLLYVGTLTGRNVEKTIEGLSLFLLKNPTVPISYDIIGDGCEGELEKLQILILKYNLQSIVKLNGRIPHFQLAPFFDRCNIGISFVPITEYYNFQPVTKTFEYILSGMYCIATNTYSNRLIISKENGLLIEDSSDAFNKSLEYVYKEMASFKSDLIKNTLKDYTWHNIVKTYLLPILNKNS